MDIKIFISHTPDSSKACLQHPLFYHVAAGSSLWTKELPDGICRDDTGENISIKNRSYGELTIQYWVWKNMQADYYGFCHADRQFSFVQKPEKAVDYRERLNEKALSEACPDENKMQELIGQHDFLIIKGVPTAESGAQSVYEQYKNMPELRMEDLDTLLRVIKEKYPKLYPAAEEYVNGQVIHPYNMYIAKQEVFQEYAAVLFDVLGEVEKRTDHSRYSRDGYRTICCLGERMAGIYYCWLKKQGTYRLGEMQCICFGNADAQTDIRRTDKKETVPVVLAADQNYVPILYTCAQSIVERTTAGRFYEIFIFHKNITKDSQRLFLEKLNRENVRVVFVNVSNRLEGYKLKGKGYITIETFYRFLILDILKDYPKVIYLDCDMIICRDIAQLYDTDMGNNLIAASLDIDIIGRCNKKNSHFHKYSVEKLGLKDYCKYFQAGVLVFHVPELRKAVTAGRLMEMAITGYYWFSDQDILNVVCKDRVKYLDMSWNVLTDNNGRWQKAVISAPYYMQDAYEQARSHPYIVHYAGPLKPWLNLDADYAHVFWEEARKTVFYEYLLRNMILQSVKPPESNGNSGSSGNSINSSIEVKHMKRTRQLLMKMLHKDSRIRRMLGKLYWKVFG